MTLEADEFLRRFLLHLLPPRFTRIRHYGLLANRARAKWLPLCRRLLAAAASSTDQNHRAPEQPDGVICPECKSGYMLPLRALPRVLDMNRLLRTLRRQLAWDTS